MPGMRALCVTIPIYSHRSVGRNAPDVRKNNHQKGRNMGRFPRCPSSFTPESVSASGVTPQATAPVSKPVVPTLLKRVAHEISPVLDLLAGVSQGIVFAGALAFICAYLYIAIQRIGYPFELEWLESNMAHEVQHVLGGHRLYEQPSINYMPFIYPPVYFYVCAGVCEVFGLEAAFPPMRAVSLAASLACFLYIYLLARRESGSRLGAFLAVGLFAATFRIGGAWFDLARVDSLMLFLLLASIYYARFGTSRLAHVFTGLLLVLAFQTKQYVLPLEVCILLGSFILHGRRALFAAFTAVAGVVLSIVLLDFLHNGWYSYYIFHQPTSYHIVHAQILGFWKNDIFHGFGLAATLAILSFMLLPTWRNWTTFFYYGGVTCGIMAITWAARLNFGGAQNVLMPAFAWIAFLCALCCVAVAEQIGQRRPARTAIIQIILCIVCLAQFKMLIYDVRAQIPSKEDRLAGETLLKRFRETKGEIFIPYHNFLPALAGRNIYVNRENIFGMLLDNTFPQRDAFLREIQDAITEKRFALIVLDRYSEKMPIHFSDTYTAQPWQYAQKNAFYPVTGMRTRPQVFLVPKTSPGTPVFSVHPTQKAPPPPK